MGSALARGSCPPAAGVALLDIAYMYSRFIGFASPGRVLAIRKQPPAYCAVSSCTTTMTKRKWPRSYELLARTARPRLVAHDDVPLHLHVDVPDSSWGEWLAASGSMALALLLAEHGIDVIGRCEAPDCMHAVVRVAPGPARRYCDSACASRTRAAADRANSCVLILFRARSAELNRQSLRPSPGQRGAARRAARGWP
jgi:hypothetical protein